MCGERECALFPVLRFRFPGGKCYHNPLWEQEYWGRGLGKTASSPLFFFAGRLRMALDWFRRDSAASSPRDEITAGTLQYLAALAFNSACAATQMVMVAMLLCAPLGRQVDRNTLTNMGQYLVRPEGEILGYFGALVVASVLCPVLAGLGFWRARRDAGAGIADALPRLTRLNFGAGLLSCTAFLLVFCVLNIPDYAAPYEAFEVVALLFPLSVSFAVLLATGAAPRQLEQLSAYAQPWRWVAVLGWEAGVVLLLFSLVYIPNQVDFMGGLRLREPDLFHWTHYGMATALGFSHGVPLVTGLYCHYGPGVPVVFALIGRLFPPLSYAAIIHDCILYACVYYVAVYIFFRLLGTGRGIALAGTLCALYVSVFSPVWDGYTKEIYTCWQWPSATVLRSPVDIWIFLCWALHIRTQRSIFFVLSGGITALALFLFTDSGLVLSVLFFLYSGLWCLPEWLNRREPSGRRWIQTGMGLLSGWGAFLGVFALAMNLATRSALMADPVRVLKEWASAILVSSGGGVASRMFALETLGRDRLVFFVLVFVSLLGLFAGLWFCVRNREARLGRLLVCLALYTLARLLVFVARSVPLYLPQALVSLVFLAVAGGLLVYREQAGAVFKERFWQRSFPGIAVLLALFGILFGSSQARYPNVFHPNALETAGANTPEGKYQLLSIQQHFQPAISYVKQAGAQGLPLAILDDAQSYICCEAGVCPWISDVGYYFYTLTLEQQQALAARLESEGPRIVLAFDSEEKVQAQYRDTWKVLQGVLSRAYEKTSDKAGWFSVWRRKKE